MRKILIGMVILSLAFALSACQSLDVVGKTAGTSFEKVLGKVADNVKADEMNNGWALVSPGGERFIWSKDFSGEGTPDLMMELDAKPFIDAGLNTEKLDQKMYFYDGVNNKLMIHGELGSNKSALKSDAKPIAYFTEIVKNYRDSIKYHEKLDHYGVLFGEGNVFEWAKDTETNDKDIVFVLNPEPLQQAGVDPSKVTGWVFAKVEIKDDNGKTELVDKLLKPYDLK